MSMLMPSPRPLKSSRTGMDPSLILTASLPKMLSPVKTTTSVTSLAQPTLKVSFPWPATNVSYASAGPTTASSPWPQTTVRFW